MSAAQDQELDGMAAFFKERLVAAAGEYINASRQDRSAAQDKLQRTVAVLTRAFYEAALFDGRAPVELRRTLEAATDAFLQVTAKVADAALLADGWRAERGTDA